MICDALVPIKTRVILLIPSLQGGCSPRGHPEIAHIAVQLIRDFLLYWTWSQFHLDLVEDTSDQGLHVHMYPTCAMTKIILMP